MSVTECATVNEVTMAASGMKRRKGITRQARNSRWSMPSRICSKPSATNRRAAWCQRGSSRTSPGFPAYSNAPHGAVRQHEPQHRYRPYAESPERGIDRESGLVRFDLVLEERVEHRLLPDDLRVGRQRRSADVGQCALVAGERPVGRQRDAHGPQPLAGQQAIVLVDRQPIPDPDHDRVAQHGVGGGQVQVAGPALREDEVPHRFQRDADEQVEALALRRHERLHRHVGGDIVRDGARG